MHIWQIWLILGVVTIISEMFHQGFVLICFSMGCFLGMLAALLHLGLSWQLGFFAIGTFIAFIGIRPFFIRFMESKHPIVKTNTDALVGEIGRVIETINPESSEGRVKIGGEDWWAISELGTLIEKDKTVIISKIEGVKVFVKRIDQS